MGWVRNSIVLKLWLTIVVMVVFVFLLLSALLQQFLDGYVRQEQTPQLEQIAATAQYLVEQHELVAVDALARIHHVTIEYSALPTTNPSVNEKLTSLAPMQRSSLQLDKLVTERYQTSGKTDIMRIFLPYTNASGHHNLIIISQNTAILAQTLGKMRNIVSFAMVIGIVMATGLAFVISNNLSRPLLQMNLVAEAMAKGDFSGQINVVTGDEVGRLGRTFNLLAGKLEQTIETLHMERDQLTSILTSLQDGVIASDVSGNITLANPPALRRLNAKWLTDSGRPESNRVPGELLTMLTSVVELHASQVREMSWQDRQMQVTMAPLYEVGGQRLRGTVAVLRDVTEERRLDRLRKDFIANVSHELRTPLSMMQGYTEALLDEFGEDPVSRRELTEIIHDETLRMRRLVNDLLDLAQLESGQFQMRLGQLDLVALIRRITRKFHALAVDSGIHLESTLPKDEVVILGDEDRLEQVFTNLLDNAVRHTSADGRVMVDISSAGQHAKIRVSDTGSGIPEEDLPYIWERFYKADKARTRGRAGIGLGLAITRHIVTEHHGDIVAHSKIGQGTTFTVILPLAEEKP